MKEWVTSGLSELLALPFPKITPDDAERLGLRSYYTIVETRSAIEAHRRMIAYAAPRMQHTDTCSRTLMCNIGWEVEWKDKVARYLLHPDGEMRGSEILSLLETTEIKEVTSSCRINMLERIRRSGVLTHEDEIIRQTIQGFVGS